MAEAPMGTIWSSSPCMIRVGTSNFFRSSVKSVSEKALMQSMTPDVWHLKLSFLYCHFLLRNDRCSGLPQRDSPPTFLSVIVRPFVGPATSHYAGSKPRAHYEIECFSATTVGRM